EAKPGDKDAKPGEKDGSKPETKADPKTAAATPATPPPSDAGVPLYSVSTFFGNCVDLAFKRRRMEREAKDVLDNPKSAKDEKAKAEEVLLEVAEADKLEAQARLGVMKQLEQRDFVQGFGSNGGEEFLSFMNIGESLLIQGGESFAKWDKTMTDSIVRVQDKDGSWSGHHCITGKTFCTSAALLVLMMDRTPVPLELIQKPGEAKPAEKK